jgi:hypothetical protein
MIYAIYINGVYKRCSEGDTKSQALNTALDKGMGLLISDKVELVESEMDKQKSVFNWNEWYADRDIYGNED